MYVLGSERGGDVIRAIVLQFAAITTAATLASPATAAPSLTSVETEFIGAVAPQGYSGDVYGTIRAGHQVCSLLDQGLSHEAIERFVVDTFSDKRDNASFSAELFAQYAAYNLCARHIGEFGNI